MNNLMKGKKGIILGVTNANSIAWEISKTLHEQGAELLLTYPRDSIKIRLEKLASDIDAKSKLAYCDVTDEKSVKELFELAEKEFGKIDFLVHSVAFSDKNELKGKYVDTTRENFLNTMDISCFSLVDLCKHAKPIMNEGASVLTLSYFGANKVMPNYNVMGVAKAALEASVMYLAEDLGQEGIRVNSISAGPIKTLAASGISDFNNILEWNRQNAPLRRNVDTQDIAKSALYLLSDMGSGVTGENHFVDAGYNIIGMGANAKG